MFTRLKENWIPLSLTLLVILLLVNTLLVVYNRSVMVENIALQKETEEVKKTWNSIFQTNLRQMDIGLRGYALTKNQQLLEPYKMGLRDMPKAVSQIDSLIELQQLDSIQDQFAMFKLKLEEFVDHSERMRSFVEQDSLEAFVVLLNMDKGYDLAKAFTPIIKSVMDHQDKLILRAQVDYQNALNNNVILQIFLVLLATPSIFSLLFYLRKEAKGRKEILHEFEVNNRQYMYDPGTTLELEDTKSVLNNSITYVKKASSFVKAITSGDYNVTWDDTTTDATIMQQDNLAGDLLKMRNKMKQVKFTDERRMWSTEGLAKFSEVARNNQNDIEKLANAVVNFFNKYLKAQQGSIFILKDDTGEEPYLELTACYAFDRKKFLQKKVQLGAGLVGQAYLERQTRVLTDVPMGYLSITSGLGDAAPSCIIIVPMKTNEKVEAVLELASFKPFEPHVVDFLEKAGEVFASAIATTKINHRTTKLLSETQQQAEVLKAQEEELRQNMEEMQATQEAVRRDALESR